MMDFDLSKENIQPLRGGRNVQQLGMALQAQTNRELQLELIQQKMKFEEIIRTYDGPDPLENYYNYISWVEQSYPKHGHEGNLVPLLENCLKLFEDDGRYTHDRRFCKLWIKYFDLQPNPLELYHMMKAKGLCLGCADLYKAWAYYYEAAGDYQSANNVFEEGKRNLAQPYEELENAHKNMIMAAGQHVLFGHDESRLLKKRHALTSLLTYQPGRVSNVRVPNSNGVVTFPSDSAASRANPLVNVYEDRGLVETGSRAEAAPVSIVTVAKRQEMPKENTLKPGPWTTVPVKKRVIGTTNSLGFTVLEDIDIQQGIRLPKNHPKECLEDYSDWHVSIIYPEPPNPAMFPMYPKSRVYIDPNTEYSIDELRATRYRQKKPPLQQPQDCEVIEILDDIGELWQDSPLGVNPPQPFDIFQRSVRPESNNPFVQQTSLQNSHQSSPQVAAHKAGTSLNSSSSSHQQPLAQPFMQEAAKPDDILNPPPPNWNQEGASNFFFIYEEAPQASSNLPPKGSTMKTAFKDLNADELAETGSRGGMDVAATAQATDSARPMPLFSDNSSSSFEDVKCGEELDNSCSTQAFNLNLNVMKVSTPYNKRPVVNTNLSEEELGNVRKQLFTEPKALEQAGDKVLSTIFEETKSFGSSSSSSGATTKSSLFNNNNNTNKLGTISEEHNSYLAQNLMANAALRSRISNFVDLPTPALEVVDVTVPMQSSPPVSPVMQAPPPADVVPLDYAPSDPFRSDIISQLLDRVCFPGPHTQGYVEISGAPRICLKKEPVLIGKDSYILEKQLGKGSYGTVYKALDLRRNKSVALKYQKPTNKWEFYVCREIQSRLNSHPIKERFMNATTGYFSDQVSFLISEYMPGGSLLDLANLHKQKAGKLKECIVMYFCIQMLQIVEVMHSVKIIHADIKPDNFLIYTLPDNTIALQLIDFGCSIDMSLFPPNTTFMRRIQTEDFVCCEMLDGRPWSYHPDLFCVAATAHVLLFDCYIKMKKEGGLWSLVSKFPRYCKIDTWNMFFSSLLNQQTGPADSKSLQLILNETLASLNRDTSTSLPAQMRVVVNLLKNR